MKEREKERAHLSAWALGHGQGEPPPLEPGRSRAREHLEHHLLFLLIPHRCVCEEGGAKKKEPQPPLRRQSHRHRRRKSRRRRHNRAAGTQACAESADSSTAASRDQGCF